MELRFFAVMGQRVELIAHGMGAFVFALFFFIGLATIVLLGAELATGNVMYLTFGWMRKIVTGSVVIKALLLCTVGNLVGGGYRGGVA